MKRLLLAIASFALALGAVSAAATSLSFGSVAAPAQGTITVSGACVSAADLSYGYAGTDGSTTVDASSGDAAYVRTITVTRTAGGSSCVGTNAAIRFDNTTGSAPVFAAGGDDPAFVGDASSGSWTFILETLLTQNSVASWSTGDSITVTVH